MARLPSPGGDTGSWGQILNDFLGSVHNTDGSLKADTIGAEQIKDDAITSDHIVAGSISAASLASDVYINSAVVDGSITTAKLADGAATTLKIADGSVTTAKLADNSVTTLKIVDANVTTAKLAASSVTTVKILDANVTTAKIADNAITSAKIASSAVDGSKVASSSISSTKLATSGAPSNGQVLGYSGGTLTWVNPSAVVTTLDGLSDVNATGATDGQALVFQSGNWIPASVASGGVTDHGALTGLTDDDHVQYLNNTRGDARYYTQAQVTSFLAGKQDTSAKGAINGYAGLDGSAKVPVSQLPSTLAMTATSKGVVIYNTGTSSYPARPTGYASVEWIGPADPDTLAQDYDTWIDTDA